MFKPDGFCIFSVATFATVLLLLSTLSASAGTGRNSNYSLLSAHGGFNTAGRGASRLAGYSPGNCVHCHEQHASIDGSQPAPVNTDPSPYMLFETLTGNAFCDYCHNGTQTNADNIAQQISKANSHDPNSIITTVLCTDCHNSHEATPQVHNEAVDGNTASGVLAGVSGVTSSWSPSSDPSPGFENINSPILSVQEPSLDEYISMEYELCLKCHGGQYVVEGLADIGRQFNPNYAATHPVTTSLWKNEFLITNAAAAMKPPWQAPDTQMYCSDCHASDTLSTEPKGPHGSTNIYLLRNAGPGASLDNLCITCHKVTTASGGTSNWVSEDQGYAADRDHDFGAHNTPTGCLACHGGLSNPALESNVHGANYRGNTNGGGGETGRLSYAFLVSPQITKNYYTGGDPYARGSRYCAASCHNAGVGQTTGYRY